MANDIIHHESGIPGAQWLTPSTMAEGMKLADLMADCTLVPDHLKKKPGDCFPILVQALRWRMDPFAVAQATAVVRGKLCYEGKLVHAVLISMGAIEGRLSFAYEGEGHQRKITVSGKPKGDSLRSITGTVAQWQTDNGNWKKDPDMMLAYRGTRAWARLYCPDAMLGVYTPDEFDDEPKSVQASVVATPEPARPAAQLTQQAQAPQAEAKAEPSPSAPAKPAALRAMTAANSLWSALEKQEKGRGTKIIGRLAAIHGSKSPKDLAPERLDAFGRDVAALTAMLDAPADHMYAMLSEWEAGVLDAPATTQTEGTAP